MATVRARRNGSNNPAAARLSISIDRGQIQRLKLASGECTAAKAIRWAIDEVVREKPDDEFGILAREILEWAGTLMYVAPREKRQLHEFGRRLYLLESSRK